MYTCTFASIAFVLLAFKTLTLASPALRSASVGIERRTIKEIYQAALKESRILKVAWGGDIRASQTNIISAFHDSFPGIRLDLTCDLSKYWDSSIDIAHSHTNGTSNLVDVAVLQSIHDFPRWKQEGRLLNYKVSEWDDLYPDFVDPDGAYTGLYIFSLGSLVYTPSFLSLLPKSQRHLTLPDLLTTSLSTHLTNGLISLTYPNDDDAVLYLFSTLVRKYGWDMMHSLARQNVSWVRGTATAAMIMANDYSSSNFNPHSKTRGYLKSLPRPIISFATEPSFAPPSRLLASSPFQKDSDPSALTYASPYITWPQTACIFRTTHNPETAKLFISFLLSSQHQLAMNGSGFATRRTFDTNGVFKQMPLMDGRGYQNFMMDRDKVEGWRLEFEKILGLPKGGNPNDIDF